MNANHAHANTVPAAEAPVESTCPPIRTQRAINCGLNQVNCALLQTKCSGVLLHQSASCYVPYQSRVDGVPVFPIADNDSDNRVTTLLRVLTTDCE